VRRSVALVVTALLAAAGPAVASTDPTAPTLRTEKVFFHCSGGSNVKLQNAEVAQGRIPTWDTKAPTASFTAGGGCGHYDNTLSSTAATRPTDAQWQGTFTGNLDRLTLELHRLLPTSGASLPNRINLEVLVDGVSEFTGQVNFTTTPSSTNASHSTFITLDKIGLAKEAGDGTKVRRVQVNVSSFNETQSAWVFDATEVPAGIEFNPAATKGVVVQ
jgi:hypothetical protein